MNRNSLIPAIQSAFRPGSSIRALLFFNQKITGRENTGVVEKEYPVVDVNRTAKALGVSPRFYVRILKKLIDSREEYLQPLHIFALHREFSELAIAAHKLKGAAAYLKIEILKELAYEIEFLARRKELVDYEALIEKINQVFDELAGIDEVK